MAWTDGRWGQTRTSTAQRVFPHWWSCEAGRLVRLERQRACRSWPIATRERECSWLVVWQDGRSGTSTGVYSTRVTNSETLTETDRHRHQHGGEGSAQTKRCVQTDRAGSSSGAIAERRTTTSNVYSTPVNTGRKRPPSRTGWSSPMPHMIQSQPVHRLERPPPTSWCGPTTGRSCSLDVYGSRVNAAGVTQNATGIPISNRANRVLAGADRPRSGLLRRLAGRPGRHASTYSGRRSRPPERLFRRAD